MKKLLSILIIGVMVAITSSCQKDEFPNTNDDGELCSLNIQTDNGAQTRSVDPEPIPGYKLRYILEIYPENKDVCYKRIVQVEEEVDNPQLFQFRLITQQSYDFLVWVDYVAESAISADLHYNTNGKKGLKEVAMLGYYYNNEAHRDAFFESFTAEIENSELVLPTVNCKRPFGQLNVVTTDWDYVSGVPMLQPKSLNIVFKAQKAFNVLTKEPVEDDEEISYASNQSLIGVPTEGRIKLTCDYIFAPSAGRLVSPIITLYNANDTEVVNTRQMLSNIPIERNYKTNVVGMLLTKMGTVNVTVNAEWEGENSVDVPDPIETAKVAN